MINPLNTHYSFTSPASIHDEEALTALELAGRQGAKINEVVTDQNALRHETEEHLRMQDADIEHEKSVVIPSTIKKEIETQIEKGSFDAQIDEHTIEIITKIEDTKTDLNGRIDNLMTNIPEGSTTLDSEVIDLRYGMDNKTYSTSGDAVRSQLTNLSNMVEDVKTGYFNFGKLSYKQYSVNTGEFHQNSSRHLSSEIIDTGEDIHIFTLNGMSAYYMIYEGNNFIDSVFINSVNKIMPPYTTYRIIIGKNNFEDDISYDDAHLVNATVIHIPDSLEQFNNLNVYPNSIVDATGKIEFDPEHYTYNTTGYIKLYPTSKYKIEGKIRFIAIYDNDKNLIEYIDGTKENYVVANVNGYIRYTIHPDYLNTSNIVRLSDKDVTEWTGKRFISHGDSITWQDGKAYSDGGIARGYQTIIKEKLSFSDYKNYGQSGYPLANGTDRGNGIVETIISTDYANNDLVIIAVGTNDFKLNVPLGELNGGEGFDRTTFYGALESSIKILQSYYPTMRMCLFTPLQRNNDGYTIHSTNTKGHKLIDYVNAIKEVGEMYSVPVCDQYANSGISSHTLTTYTRDGLHPNDLGYERMGNYAVNFIKLIGR